MRALRVISGLTIALAIAGVVHAEDPKPAIAVTTKAIELTVTIDPALRAFPGLYDNLLAEGRRDAEKWRRDATEERSGDRTAIREGRRWTYDRIYHLRSVVLQRYVSILRDDGSYEGGAHPNSVIDTILWDAMAKKRMSVRPFFKETADNGPTMTALAKAVRSDLVQQKKRNDVEVDDPDKDTWLDAVTPQLLKLGPVTLAPSTEAGKSSGLTFHFSPYGVGAYAEGLYTAFVPWTDFKAYLSGEGQAIFSGERPANDADQN
jgi:hypothetical protein